MIPPNCIHWWEHPDDVSKDFFLSPPFTVKTSSSAEKRNNFADKTNWIHHSKSSNKLKETFVQFEEDGRHSRFWINSCSGCCFGTTQYLFQDAKVKPFQQLQLMVCETPNASTISIQRAHQTLIQRKTSTDRHRFAAEHKMETCRTDFNLDIRTLKLLFHWRSSRKVRPRYLYSEITSTTFPLKEMLLRASMRRFWVEFITIILVFNVFTSRLFWMHQDSNAAAWDFNPSNDCVTH